MQAMAKKRRGERGGRPRRDGRRWPSGDLRQPEKEAAGPTSEILARRADGLCAVIRVFPQKFARPLASDPDAEWHIGRLYLCDVLTRRQRDAADRLRKAVAAYSAALRAVGAPGNPQALDLDRVTGRSSESDARYMRRFRRAKQEYDLLHAALAAEGHDVARAVAGALRDQDVRLDWLRRGLDALDRA